ncbi:unnamed protein product [Meganyctiphanes norvegica]|uniref:Uncharacterized protein n=1 Tax=Meganyctiphanes norvegica TaxID=48144 RepID=A0AAV2QDY9_MEGNR
MMWPQSCSMVFLAVGLSLLCMWPSVAQGARRFDCRRFCMRTGFRGTVGGCRCQFTLFTNKRGLSSDLSDSRLAKRSFLPAMEEHLDELPQFSDLTTADILALAHQVPAARAKLLYPYLAGLNEGAADYEDNYDVSDILNNALANEVPSSNNAPAENNEVSTFDVTRLANQITEPKTIINTSTNQATPAKTSKLPEKKQLVISRKELEQQLNNGDDSDYIRISFN